MTELVTMPSILREGNFGIVRSVSPSNRVHLSVPWRSCLGYRHAGCLQLSHCRPPEICDGCRSTAIFGSNCHQRGAYRLAASGAIPCFTYFLNKTTCKHLTQYCVTTEDNTQTVKVLWQKYSYTVNTLSINTSARTSETYLDVLPPIFPLQPARTRLKL